MLSDPRITTPENLKVLRAAMQSHGIELVVYEAATPEEIVPAIEHASKEGAQGVNVLATPLFSFNSQRIIDCMGILRLPAIYQWPEIAEDGGFLAYGPRITRMYRQMARQLIKLIHGVKVAEVPVEQPTVFEFIVNLKTAKALGINVLPTLLVRADEVIE